MAGIFKVNEVVAAAVEIEKRGEDFYRRLAQKTENQAIRKDLEYLADEEVKHRKLFQSMVDRLEPIDLPAWSDEGEYYEYLSALIESHFLLEKKLSESLLSWVSNRREAVHLAMGFEKESILFFMEMKELVPEGERTTVEKCIQEEREHLRRLKGMVG